MRLLISPASASLAAACEEESEVVRVHRQAAGFGLGAVVSKHSTVPSGHVQSGKPAKNERRCAQRRPFIATTEVIDVRTGARLSVRTADLSTGGCYIDTLNPFPLHTTVWLQIQKENATVEFRAKAAFRTTQFKRGRSPTVERLTSVLLEPRWASISSPGCQRSTSVPSCRCLQVCACAKVNLNPEEPHGANDLDPQAQRCAKGPGGWNGVHLRAPVSGAGADGQAHQGKGLEPITERQRERWHHVPGAVLRFVWQELHQRPRENGQRTRAGVSKPLPAPTRLSQ